MNAFLKKEIRLLLPSFFAILLLETLLPWFFYDADRVFGVAPAAFFFGMALLAVDSFGREFSLGTFQSLMAQPVERQKIWQIKLQLLLWASGLIFLAYFASCGWRVHEAIAVRDSVWRFNPNIIRSDFHQAMYASITLLLIAFVGGLWTTLLVRQVAAAFWLTLLTPAGLLMLIVFFLPAKLANNEHVLIPLLYCAAGVYIVSGFWLARRLYYQAQDVGWAGGLVVFSKWRYFEGGSPSVVSLRRRRPFAALVKKEFQLQSISWFCAAALLVLHLAVIAMRYGHGNFEQNSMAGTVSEFYFAVWLILPLIIGCTLVAEERRLGTMEGQACLPASQRWQFILKFVPAICSGVILGAVIPLMLEVLAALIGSPNPGFHNRNDSDAIFTLAGLALGLSFAGCYASTLAKSFLQAMSISALVIVGAVIFTIVAVKTRGWPGVVELNPALTIGLAVLTMLLVIPVLSYRNFKFFQETGRFWRRNVFGLVGAGVFIFVASAALYNRVWEVFQPDEPAHGPARLALANPPIIHFEHGASSFSVHLPDGRVWFDRIGYHNSGLLRHIIIGTLDPLPSSLGPQQFSPGSNWTSFAVRHKNTRPDANTFISGQLEAVGIKRDGTLWISEKSAEPLTTDAPFKQFGGETNWQSLSRSESTYSILLLKMDGTLWRWGTNQASLRETVAQWPALQSFNPHQIGTNSDWKEIAYDHPYAQKADGSTWRVCWDAKKGRDGVMPATYFDQVDFKKTFLDLDVSMGAKILKNGTLCFWNVRKDRIQTYQCGSDTNWNNIAGYGWFNVVALKSDGTLWNCLNPGQIGAPPIRMGTPIRMGIHNDWVAITASDDRVVTLAADGSLWLWPTPREYWEGRSLLKLPKQPKRLGNVFAESR